MHGIDRHRIVPVKAGCAVAEVRQRVVHKSGAVDALCADVLLSQWLIAGTEPVLAICLPIRLTAKRSARSPQIQHKTDLQNAGCRLHEVHKATSHLRALPASVRNTHIWWLSAFISTICGGTVVVCVVVSGVVVVVLMVVVSGGIVVCTVVSCIAVVSV